MYRTLSAPLSVQLEITNECNNNCIHCYNHWRNKKHSPSFLGKENLEKIVEELEKNRVFSVTITGGEPLLRKDLTLFAYKLLKAADIDCSINSNLTVIDEVFLKELTKIQNGKLSFLTSLLSHKREVHDKLTEHKGSWERTVNNIRLLKSKGVSVGVNLVILKDNYSHIYNTAKFLNSLGVKFFSATKCSPPMNSKNCENFLPTTEMILVGLKDLMRAGNDFGLSIDSLECYPLCMFGNLEEYEPFLGRCCSAGVYSATIGYNGELRPCSHFDVSYGNIINESLRKIWYQMKDCRDGSMIPQTCKECKIFYQCTGGCRMEAKYYGKINDMDPHAVSPDNIIPMQKKKFNLDFDISKANLAFNKDTKIRSENFGGVLKIKRNTVFINRESYKIISELLNQNREFNLKFISSEYEINLEKEKWFFEKLYTKGFIDKIN